MSATATRTRPRLRDHLHVGARVISTIDMSVWRLANLWDADHQAQLVHHATGERHTVTYTELLRDFELCQPFSGVLR